MLSNDEQKKAEEAQRPAAQGALGELAAPRTPPEHVVGANDHDPRSQLKRALEHVENKYRDWFISARPEVHLVTQALAFTRFAMTGHEVARVITVQTEQLMRAFISFGEGASVIDIVEGVLARDLFPPTVRGLVDDYRHYIRGELRSKEFIDSLPENTCRGQSESFFERRSPRAMRSHDDIATIHQALSIATSKIISELPHRSHDGIRSVDACPPHFDKFLELLKHGHSGRVSRRDVSAPPGSSSIDYQGLERHYLGKSQEPSEISFMIFEDVAWVASALTFNGYSSDATVAAILLHTSNSLNGDDRVWMSDAAERMSEGVRKILAVTRPAQPNPIRNPGTVSVLNCQRPLQIIRVEDGAVREAAQAIAVASVLSPAYQGTMDEVLGVIPLLRALHDPPFFTSVAKARCFELGLGDQLARNDQGSDGKRGVFEIRGVLGHFRVLYTAPGGVTCDQELIRPLHYSSMLTFDLISEKGALDIISDGLLHPFFGDVSKSTLSHIRARALGNIAFLKAEEHEDFLRSSQREEVEKTIPQVSDQDAHQFVQELSSQLVARITPEHRGLRWQSGLLTSLDFTERSEGERYNSIAQRLGVPRSATHPTGVSLAQFVSERGPEIVEHVVSIFKKWAHRNSSQRDTFIDDVVGIVRGGGFLGTGSNNVRSTEDPERIRHGLLDFMAEHPVGAEELGLWRILRRLQLEIHLSDERVVVDPAATTREICSFLRAESTRGLTDWGATNSRKIIALSLGLIPARAPRELAPIALYTPEERRKFSVASEQMINVLQSLEATGTPRSQAQSYRHCMEVGTILALSGAPSDLVIAGILHDLYEFVAKANRASGDEGSELTRTRKEIRELFGADVDKLIDLVSEVRGTSKGSEVPFLPRKMAIFKKVEIRHKSDPVLARKAVTLLLATKVSTINEGQLTVEEQGDSQPWSKGDYLDNLAVMIATRRLAERFCQPNVMMELFDQQINKWCRAAEHPKFLAKKGAEYLWGSRFRPRDPLRALPLLFKAAREGDKPAMHYLGLGYLRGLGVTQSSSCAARILNFALKKGDFLPIGLTFMEYEIPVLKKIYESGASNDERDADRKEVIRHLEELATRGDANAEYQLGLCYLHGWGVSKSPLIALRQFNRAAGSLEGVRHSRAIAREQGQFLPSGGDPEHRLLCHVLFEIGQILERGVEGVPEDPERAFACYNEFSDAQPPFFDEVLSALFAALARMHREGRGTLKDEEKARDYQLKADHKLLFDHD